MFLFVLSPYFVEKRATRHVETTRAAAIRLQLRTSFVVRTNLSCVRQTTPDESSSSHVVFGAQPREESGSADVYDYKALARPDASDKHILTTARNATNANDKPPPSSATNRDPDAEVDSVNKQQLNDKRAPSGNKNGAQNSNPRAQRDNSLGASEGAHVPGEHTMNGASNTSNEESSSELDVHKTGLEEHQGISKVRRKSTSRTRTTTISDKKPTPLTRRRKTARKDSVEKETARVASDKEKESTKRTSKNAVSSNEALGTDSTSSSRRRRGRPRKAKPVSPQQVSHLQALEDDSSKSIKAEGGRGTVKGKEISKPGSQPLLSSRQGIDSLEGKKISVDKQRTDRASHYVREIDTQSTRSNSILNSDGTTDYSGGSGSVKSSATTAPVDHTDKISGSDLTTQQHMPSDDPILLSKEHAGTGHAAKVKAETDDKEDRNVQDFTCTEESEGGPKLQPRPLAEQLVLKETSFRDGRYGTCFSCGQPVVIPGLAQFYCENCGWIRRPIEAKAIIPGHHD